VDPREGSDGTYGRSTCRDTRCYTVQVICKDGTRIHCRDFKATDSGVLFFQDAPGEESDEEQDEEERGSADGFIPVTELRFVLPSEPGGRER